MNSDSALLKYGKPASAWTQALPIGNGSLGAMIYGKTDKEIIALNHDELWSGFPQDKTNKGSYKHFLKARELALGGELLQAQELIEKKCLGTWTQAYMPLGNLKLDFGKKTKAENYRRSLDLTNAVAAVEYQTGETVYKREAFASFPAKAVFIRLTAQGPGKLNFTVSFDSELRCTVFTENGLLIADGECPSEFNRNGNDRDIVYFNESEKRGVQFRAAARADTDGTAFAENGRITIQDATQAVLIFACETSFNGWDKQPFLEGKEYKNACLNRVLSAGSYEESKADHIDDYKRYYNRVALDIGSDDKAETDTDKRLRDFQRKKDDRGLYTLLFNYGRYLAIACSREGSQPSNLQGIWNDLLTPPWHANYTVNINTEMNYWPILPCAMPELNGPLIGMIKDIAVSGRRTAMEHYNAPGFVCHHNIDLWRHTIPVAGHAVYAFWPMASGWLCRHLYEHFEYTLDTDFLKNTAYPIMKSAAEFYLAMLVPDAEGCLIFAPSTSPENSFILNGRHCAVSQTSTMTMSIIKDLFIQCLKACEQLRCDGGFQGQLRAALEKMPPFKTGSKGQLLEWYEEAEETEPHHRHVSHLYALHPANLITVDETPDLAQACRKTLTMRGDEGTGWSLGWKINFWARLRDGNHALRLLDKQLRFVKSSGFNYRNGGGTYANLFDAHPPFQIDGNFGAVSGIVEMLIQSTPGTIRLLPALPGRWANGRVKGLLAKSGITVAMAWESGELAQYELTGKGAVTVVCKEYTAKHDLDGKTLTVDLRK